MPFRPSPLVYAKKSSSTVWLSRQSRDPYVKLRASPNGTTSPIAASYRSRSAFKLLEMEEKWGFLDKRDVQVVLDLGCAPGGWSQVVAQKLGWDRRPPRLREQTMPYPEEGDSWSAPSSSRRKAHAVPSLDDAENNFDPLNISALAEQLASSRGRGTIIGVDLLRMAPIPGVQFIQADFLSPDTEAPIRGLVTQQAGVDGKADVVLCDMASNSTGNAFHDIESSLAICTSVLEFSKKHLRSAQSVGREMGGVLLIKHFVHPLLTLFRREQLIPNFNDVRFLKPNASRTESKEGYFLCRGWKG
ncbi:ribosomal RNA large subunit methyltransferase J [Mycena crocata]|nr:ribosomal RNA large subunit methyltransferase J [Mycena crocata]